VLCHSLAGNAVYVVTITSRGGGRVAGRTKKAVVVTARVHPGETNGSWMMEGLLDFLLGDSEDAQLLRDTFVFKVTDLELRVSHLSHYHDHYFNITVITFALKMRKVMF